MDVEVKITLSGETPAHLQDCARQIMLLVAAKLIEASVAHEQSDRQPTRG